MNTGPTAAIDALNRRFLLDYPAEAAQQLEKLAPGDAAAQLAAQPVHVVLPVWEYLSSDSAEALLGRLPPALQRELLTELEPSRAANLLARMNVERQQGYFDQLDPQIQAELRSLIAYEPDTAGRLMDPRIVPFRPELRVHEAEARLRARKPRAQRELFLIDERGHLSGRVEIQELAVADPEQLLGALARPIVAAVQDITPREEVVGKIEQHKLTALPVVDFSGRLIGVIHHTALVTALQEETSVDIQTMVGASRDERALSATTFAVRKRLPWLHVNLLTAFLAASVVALFEGTIAKFTALAVLMPIVAGESGNAGQQALAVTMRGLALREIGVRHGLRVVFKEINVGLLNGLAVAATAAFGVYLWSGSPGLALVIAVAMVTAMIAACFSGALIPITLTRLGQDPAQSSSIILTTITDVVGFLSFLGIATLLSAML